MPPKSKTPKKKDVDKPPPVEEKFQGVEVSTKDPCTVVLMLGSPETVIVCKACESIKNYAEMSDSNCAELKELGAVIFLLKLLPSVDKIIRSYAVLCLTSMTNNAEVRQLLLNTDCIPLLLKLVTPDEETITQERASYTLANLAEDYSFKVKLLKCSAHQPFITVAQSTADPDVQRNCIKGLALMLEHFEARPALLEAGGLPLILDYLSSEYAIIQELVLKALHSFCHHAGCRKALIEGDGLGKVVSFLGKREWSDLHTLAVSVLALILEEADSMAALQSSDLLQQLLTHIRQSTVNEAKKQSAKALAKSARNSVNQRILTEQHVEKTFIELISHGDCGVVVAACDGLTEMAALSSSKQAVGSEGGIASLVECLGREEPELRTAAVRTLATLINDTPANCKLLSEAGGVESLIPMLQDNESLCRQYAADCVTAMAPDESLRSELINSGIVPALVDCLAFKDTSVQLSAVQALGMLSCDSETRSQLMISDGVTPLLLCLQSQNSQLVQTSTWTLAAAAQSTEVAKAVSQMGGLELVKKLCSSPKHSLSNSARIALNKLLNANISAKYWLTGRLDQTDFTTESEFFDAGLNLSSSLPFTALSELQNRPVSISQPILTVNLLAKPPPVIEDAPCNLDASHSSTSVISRSKSRQLGSKEGKRKNTKVERDSEAIQVLNSDDVTQPTDSNMPSMDTGLWEHISHVKKHIQPLRTLEEQIHQLAKYVSDCLGGVVERSDSFGCELTAGELQHQLKSNAVPLGEITIGGFRHRALLFKVLCDQLGIPCSLVRGEYSRHWNEVCVQSEGSVRVCVVDLIFTPGTIMDATSPTAIQYQHIL